MNFVTQISNFPLYIFAPLQWAFEKYKPRDLLSEFYGINRNLQREEIIAQQQLFVIGKSTVYKMKKIHSTEHVRINYESCLKDVRC